MNIYTNRLIHHILVHIYTDRFIHHILVQNIGLIHISIFPSLIDGDPDVDAYYRMTRKNAKEKLHLNYDAVGPPVALPKGTFSPSNSQNTLYTYDGFWAMMIPASTTFRSCDIYRSYWSQPLMWAIGKQLGFYPPNSVHYRNAHNYIDDAMDELDFIRMSRLLKALKSWQCKKNNLVDCIKSLTQLFIDLEHYKYSDLELASAWLEDLLALNYEFPEPQGITKGSEVLEVKYYPEEMSASLPHKREYYISQEGRGLPAVAKFIDQKCQISVFRNLMPIYSDPAKNQSAEILMVIFDNTKNADDIMMLESYHHLTHSFIGFPTFVESFVITDLCEASLYFLENYQLDLTKQLKIHRGNLTDISQLTNRLCDELTILQITHNKVQNSILQFSKHPKLHHLDLSHNSLTFLQLGITGKNFSSLNLSHNAITDLLISVTASKSFSIDLSYNKLHDLQFMIMLKNNVYFINLKNNNIMDITDLAKISIQQPISINIYNNSFVCNCANKKALIWAKLQRHHIIRDTCWPPSNYTCIQTTEPTLLYSITEQLNDKKK